MKITRPVDGWCRIPQDTSAPVTRGSPATKRHLGRRISDLPRVTPRAVRRGGGGDRRWHPKVANPGPQPPCLFLWWMLGEVMLQLLQAMPGSRCAPRHGSFLEPGGSSCSDFKLVARTRAEPRKRTEKLLKGVGGCAAADTEKPAPDRATPGLPLEARDCLLVIFFLWGHFGEILNA